MSSSRLRVPQCSQSNQAMPPCGVTTALGGRASHLTKLTGRRLRTRAAASWSNAGAAMPRKAPSLPGVAARPVIHSGRLPMRKQRAARLARRPASWIASRLASARSCSAKASSLPTRRRARDRRSPAMSSWISQRPSKARTSGTAAPWACRLRRTPASRSARSAESRRVAITERSPRKRRVDLRCCPPGSSQPIAWLPRRSRQAVAASRLRGSMLSGVSMMPVWLRSLPAASRRRCSIRTAPAGPRSSPRRRVRAAGISGSCRSASWAGSRPGRCSAAGRSPTAAARARPAAPTLRVLRRA